MRDYTLWYSVSQKGGKVFEIFPGRSSAERYVASSKGGGQYEIKPVWRSSCGSGRILKEAVICTDETIDTESWTENKTFFQTVVRRAYKSFEAGSDIVTAIKDAVNDEVAHHAGRTGRAFRPFTGLEGENSL